MREIREFFKSTSSPLPQRPAGSNINLLAGGRQAGEVAILNMPEAESLPARRLAECSLPRNDETCQQPQFSPCSHHLFSWPAQSQVPKTYSWTSLVVP